jgi:hypothetical protein
LWGCWQDRKIAIVLRAIPNAKRHEKNPTRNTGSWGTHFSFSGTPNVSGCILPLLADLDGKEQHKKLSRFAWLLSVASGESFWGSLF